MPDCWRPTTNSLRRFLRRPVDERRAALRSILKIGIVKRRLRRDGYQQTLEQLTRASGEPIPAGVERRWAMAAEAAMKRWPGGTSCLERSLVIWWLLGGAPAEIRFGVAPGEDRPTFHAWVETGGLVVNDDPDIADRYAPFEAAVPPTRFD